MTPEARQVELEQFETFTDMRRTPTHSWAQFSPKNKQHHLIRFLFIARDYGIEYRTKKLSAAEAVDRHRDRVAAETPPLS